MNNTENEVKKIKTQIVPAIHNTVSLQVYLKTEDGNAIANKEIHYKFLIDGSEEPKTYKRTTDENGTARLNIRLMAGEYIITSQYESAVTSNIIEIKP